MVVARSAGYVAQSHLGCWLVRRACGHPRLRRRRRGRRNGRKCRRWSGRNGGYEGNRRQRQRRRDGRRGAIGRFHRQRRASRHWRSGRGRSRWNRRERRRREFRRQRWPWRRGRDRCGRFGRHDRWGRLGRHDRWGRLGRHDRCGRVRWSSGRRGHRRRPDVRRQLSARDVRNAGRRLLRSLRPHVATGHDRLLDRVQRDLARHRPLFNDRNGPLLYDRSQRRRLLLRVRKLQLTTSIIQW